MNFLCRLGVVSTAMTLFVANVMAYDIRNGVTIEIRSLPKTFSVHPLPIELWVYCLAGVPVGTPGECDAPTYPSPLLELGVGQTFELHNVDGRAQTATSLVSIELSPGQTKEILVTLPATATTWYPVITYKHLRDDSVLANVFNTITIQ